MTKQLTKEEVISRLTIQVREHYKNTFRSGTLIYALEYVDWLAGLGPFPKSETNTLSAFFTGRPCWLDNSINNHIQKLHVQLLNVGREEHDFSILNPEAEWDKLCAKCGKSKTKLNLLAEGIMANGCGVKLLCCGYPSSDW